jgi:hypothetical protein
MSERRSFADLRRKPQLTDRSTRLSTAQMSYAADCERYDLSGRNCDYSPDGLDETVNWAQKAVLICHIEPGANLWPSSQTF